MRKIIHIDMDAFFAAVEERDHPEYRGKPVVVGGNPKSRGVVATASYEARRFGIHSAMPTARAYRLCPAAVFVKPRMDAYRKASEVIHRIFRDYTDEVESMGIDEAYLDVTRNKKNIPSAMWAANQIRADIQSQTLLTASAGVSYNKFLAKMASDMNKPNGITVITPNDSQKIIDRLPIGKFHGIGKATESKMLALGIRTGFDLRQHAETDLVYHFGKVGAFYFNIARGNDQRPLCKKRSRKSVGAERTFASDIEIVSQMDSVINELSEEVSHRLQKLGASGKTVTVKIRYHDFTTITRSKTFDEFIKGEKQISLEAKQLLRQSEVNTRPVRLLGITLANLDTNVEESVNNQPMLPL